jgi:CheY-like chemotaxis protein
MEPCKSFTAGTKEFVTTRACVFLYVEDSPDDVVFLEHAFRKKGYGELHSLSDGQEAIEYLNGEGKYADREKNPLPDVILLDLKMPRVDGFGFLKWLHEKAPADLRRVPVIVMSTSDDPGDVNRAYDLGVNCYLTKPVDWDLFQERMKLVGKFWGEHAEKPTAVG